ncbi:hypothetical protein OC846_006738 [Tilletia horrida]|uniref:HNH nuclease domain-containing protein n=1 Tax=Tilletia horrida TaxID=155126 RepID=A0AAN6JNR6_9BASI|nr:hypothetical protein OC845_006743 [Tilletia horrida]KAK0542437.1 hypothetical protein OC846_006738 [Tilletia horrida]
MGAFLDLKSYATVPISVKPGSGKNIVHLDRAETTTPPEQLCSATARMLDLRTLLEMPLMVLGIQMKPEQNTHQEEHLWPDRAKVAGIEVVRIPLRRPIDFAITATELTPEDFAGTIWDFVQPVRNWIVIIHIHIKSITGNPRLSVHPQLQPLLDKIRKSSAPPRDSTFRVNVSPGVCPITGSYDVAEAAHIIQRTLNFELVDAALRLLFDDLDSTSSESSAVTALFHYRTERILHQKLDEAANGIYLSPSLHRIFDQRRTIWFLRQRCYILGPPVCYDELAGFDPPCPSLYKVRKIKTGDDFKALWEEQLLHEQQVSPLRCLGLSETQECLLHLSALLSFFTLFMAQNKAMKNMLERLGVGSDGDLTANPNEEPRRRKRSTEGEREVPSTVSPANSDDCTETGMYSDLDSDSEEESEWDEDEENRRRLLHDDTLALLLMKHNLTSGVGRICV